MKYTRTDTEAESRLLLEGSLDAHTVTTLRPITEGLAAKGTNAVVVDLAELAMIDSSGIGLLVALAKRLRAESRTFQTVNVSGQPLMVIKVLKLETVLGLV